MTEEKGGQEAASTDATETSPAISTTTEANANGEGIDTESNNVETEKVDESCESRRSQQITIPEPEPPLKHNWDKGDHIIRWEMLPIAYPIQIHAIVLEANEEFVKLVDFGLTAIPDHEKDETERKKKYELLHKYLVKPLHKSKKKERLNIRVLTTQKELKPFSKVNYNGGFLGMGGKNSKDGGDEASKKKKWLNMFGKKKTPGGGITPTNDDAATVATIDDDEATSVTVATMATEDSTTKEAQAKEPKSEDGAAAEEPAISANDDSTNPQDKTATIAEPQEDIESKATAENGGEDDSKKKQATLENEDDFELVENDQFKQEDYLRDACQSTNKKRWIRRQAESMRDTINEKRTGGGLLGFGLIPTEKLFSKSGSHAVHEGDNGGVDGSSEQQQEHKETSKFMNPAMAKLMNGKGKNSQSPSSSPVMEKKFSFDNGDILSKEVKENLKKLRKDDPTELVLARVYFLLEHGETVLPPYNVFHANSETIAVWCMTGHFRTIQADVFLHSTAIGNGKSATCVALGVAATSGLAAAGVAGIGVAAVIAPWWYLKHSKDKCGDATTSLNDAFWAQADPEVFVECIGKWGRGSFKVDDEKDEIKKLEEGSITEEEDFETEKEDDAAGATAATTTSIPPPADNNNVTEAATIPA